jgi:hypothetical protein
MNFFIFSLPRSGSAWLSVFLTHGKSFCYHEPLSEQENLDVLFSRPGIVGAVDTQAYTKPAIRNRYRSFVLKRDISQIERSSHACGVNYTAPVDEFESGTSGLEVIEYSKLDQISYLEEVWRAVVGTGFDKARAARLIDMNIQRDLHRFKLKVPAFAHFIDNQVGV